MIIVYRWQGHFAIYLTSKDLYLSFRPKDNYYGAGKYYQVAYMATPRSDEKRFGRPDQIIPIVSSDSGLSETLAAKWWNENGKYYVRHNSFSRNACTLIYKMLLAAQGDIIWWQLNNFTGFLGSVQRIRNKIQSYYRSLPRYIWPEKLERYARSMSDLAFQRSGKKALSLSGLGARYGKSLYRPGNPINKKEKIKCFWRDNKSDILTVLFSIGFGISLIMFPGVASFLHVTWLIHACQAMAHAMLHWLPFLNHASGWLFMVILGVIAPINFLAKRAAIVEQTSLFSGLLGYILEKMGVKTEGGGQRGRGLRPSTRFKPKPTKTQVDSQKFQETDSVTPMATVPGPECVTIKGEAGAVKTDLAP